jgi:hypothetical protein
MILTQRWLSLDPSSTSLGYAIVDNGKIEKSGEIIATGSIGKRLHHMYQELRLLGPFKGIVLEKVRGPRGHIYLLWSAGVAAAAVGALTTLEIPTKLWSLAKNDQYFKGDEADAIYMAKFCLAYCREEIT